MPPLLPQHPEFRERIAALKHDLGKYVAWRSVNLPDDAWTGAPSEQLVEALVADVLSTRSAAEGGMTAWEVFDAHMIDVPRPWPVPELAAVDEAVARLRACGPALVRRDRQAIAECRATIRDAQATIRRELAALHRRLVQSEKGG